MRRALAQLLGLQRDANEDQIKKGYRREAIRWHPDKNPNDREAAEARFKLIAEAYETLADARTRRAYDADPGRFEEPR